MGRWKACLGVAAMACNACLAVDSDLARMADRLPENLQGAWITTANDREGVARLAITVDIRPNEIRWTIDCDMPDGSKDHDSVTTPARVQTGFIEITRRAGSFGERARPCELGIREKLLSYHLEDGVLQLADFAGKMRSFTRSAGTSAPRTGAPGLALQWGDASRCTVTPAYAELRLGERGLFKVSAPGFSSPMFRSEMRYVGDPSGGLRFARDAKPVTRNLDAVDVTDGLVRAIRSYKLVDEKAANREIAYASQYPGGVVETVELREGNRRAMCEYRVRLLPDPPADVPGSRAASASAPLR